MSRSHRMLSKKALPLLKFFTCFTTLFLCFACASGVKFQGRDILTEKPLDLRGTLYKPSGEGPFPAVVVMHDCSGRNALSNLWSTRLQNWGYVAFEVDSIGPRGGKTSCTAYSGGPSYMARTLDAFYAKAYLNQLPFVKHDNVGLMGFSHGGGVTVTALDSDNMAHLPAEIATPFKVGVAYYPYCTLNFKGVDAPIMVLTGEADEWHSEYTCRLNIPEPDTIEHEFVYKSFEGANHCFDWPGLDTTKLGYKLKYHPEAAAQAKKMTQEYFEKYLTH